MRSTVRLPLIAALLLFGAPLRAQSIGVVGVQPLAFGTMLPGIAAVASRTDPSMAARIDITGKNKAAVLLVFTLPSVMQGPGGATLPLSYSASDAGWSDSRSITNQIAFDPRVPYVGTLSNKGASVFLGGTARPAANQPPGNYSATLTLTVVYF